MTAKKGILWQIIHASSELRVLLYFLLFALQVIIFTAIFHSIYPMLEGKPTVYVCEGFVCRQPVTRVEELRALLAAT